MRRNKRKNKTPSQFQIDSYPAGTFITTEKGTYFVNGPKRLPFITQRVLDSWSPIRIIKTTEDHPAVKSLKVGMPMKFRNGSLLYSHASGRMYLIIQGRLRHVTNPDVIEALGFSRSDALPVSLAEINLHEKGEAING